MFLFFSSFTCADDVDIRVGLFGRTAAREQRASNDRRRLKKCLYSIGVQAYPKQ